jgi:O-antigen ligase/polysaccharide polymerase Wzy-like membrane protein
MEPVIHVHDAATSMHGRRRWNELALGAVLTFVAAAAFLFGPRGAPVEIVLLALAPVAALAMEGSLDAALRPTPLLLACLLFGCYIAINASWSVDLGEAYGKVLFFFVMIATVHLALLGLPRLSDVMLHTIERAALAGVLTGAAFLAIEVLTEQGIKRLFFSLVPLARPDPKHIQVLDGWVTQINAYMLNRNMAALSLALWPALLIVRTLLGPRRGLLLGVGLFAISAVAIFKSEHETSMIALVFASATFIGMSLLAPLMRRLVLIGWIVATLLVVPIALLAYVQQLHFAQWIPETGRNRIILWGYTAGVISKAPILGTGVASTKELDEERAATAARPAGYTYPLRTGRHSHNVYMQTWYELGAVGALLLCGIGLLGIRLLSTFPDSEQPFAFASFVSAVMIGAFSWGMWQVWFMASFGIWAILVALAHEGERRSARASAPDLSAS